MARRCSSAWDPERSLALEPLPWRSIQIGLGQHTATQYASTRIRSIDDVTPRVREIKAKVDAGDTDGATLMLPDQGIHPLPPAAAAAVGVRLAG
jgi:hypothetical protein